MKLIQENQNPDVRETIFFCYTIKLLMLE